MPGPQTHAAAMERGTAALGRVPPVLLLLTGATSVQFGAALGTTLFDELGPAGASLLRLGLAAIVLWAAWRPVVRAYDARAIRLAIVFGLVLGGMNFSFYEALDRIPLGVAVTIEFIGPIALATILSRRPLDFVWIALAAAGIVLLAAPGSADSLDTVGLVFVFIAATCWALYILLAQRVAGVFRGGDGLAIAMVAGTLVPLVPGVIEGGSSLLDPGLLAIGLCVALLSSVIPYSLELEALRRISARVFGVLMSLEPVVAAIAGFIVLGQDLSARDLVAIGLVVAASVGVTRTAATPGSLMDA